MPVTFTETSTATFPQPAAGGRMTMIDADGDGDMDILYQIGANGTAYQYARSNGDGTYSSGKVWAPDRDKTYKAKMVLDGNALGVSGCVLGGAVCRESMWSRVK